MSDFAIAITVRCADCGVGIGDPDVPHPFRGCGNDPLTLERRDGPRYVEAIRGARHMRRFGFGPHGLFRDGNYGTGAYANERLCGIPEQWWDVR